eukprot:gene4110-2956_t
MKPHAAQLRQQQSQQRRARLQESLARANVDPALLARQQQRPRDRTRQVITQAEWEELVEQHEDSGKIFRRFFFAVVIAVCLLILYGKYDVEYNLEVPQIENGQGFSGEAKNHGARDSTSLKDLEKYFETLGVQQRFTTVEDASDVEEAKQRRLENYRVKKEVERAYKEHLESQNQLVYCGRSCSDKQGAMQTAYNKLNAHVERELFGVLLDAEDTKSKRTTSQADLLKKYEEKKAKIEATEKDEEVRSMELEELRDALEVLQSPEGRQYYLFYGEKPPEHMRYVSARHGGWGQELALGTFKYKLVIMWLDYLHQHFGLWGETIVLLVILGGVLSKLPTALQQSMQVLDDLDWDTDQAEQRQKED